MGLKKLIADLVYEADWEIEGTLNSRVKDITTHLMNDETQVVDKIVDAVIEDFKLWLDDRPPLEGELFRKSIIYNYISAYIQGLER